ncbi:MAG TPA: DegT/DnrJ/EryC1/StrS family aminotransferase [Myxococcota bacterium]|nr:DegT/DnrJ/EryC1/StrS family aminotransferase [Myxococcota bacterium]
MPARRWPPGGEAFTPADLWGAARVGDPERELRDALRRRLGCGDATLHASGREAMRVALGWLAKERGRDEVLIPAYTCFSIPASAIAAGLRVRLVDVTLAGRVDPRSLESLPLERAAALVVGNLFGVPEPVGALRERLSRAGVALIDDAAQALGARTPEGVVGARGDLGILSFGRGKPLGALGGGAIAWPGAPALPSPPTRPRRALALAKALAYDAALQPAVFGALAAIPALHIGETPFEPGFVRGAIDGASLCLAAVAERGLDARARERARRADALAADVAAAGAFQPIVAARADVGVYPRLALVAPSADARDAALAALRELGASGMYPSSLDAIAALRPHLAGEPRCPTARELAARLLTLPTHRELRGSERARLLEVLATGGARVVSARSESS